MIKLIKDYVIDADDVGYVCGKLKTIKDKKTGKEHERITRPKYYSTFEGAIYGLIEIMRHNHVKYNDKALKEVIEDFRELNKQIECELKCLDYVKEEKE